MRQHHPIELDVDRINWLIRHWRKIQDDPESANERKIQAIRYVQAFKIVLKEHGVMI